MSHAVPGSSRAETLGTSGTYPGAPSVPASSPAKTSELRHFSCRGTSGTGGTPVNDNVGSGIRADAKGPSEWGDGLARLRAMTCPDAYTPERWARLADDGRRFLDRWGTDAEALGWTAIDVFGMDKDAPEARGDLKGLVPALNGSEVVILAADRAKVQKPGGKPLTFYRRSRADSRILVWDMASTKG